MSAAGPLRHSRAAVAAVLQGPWWADRHRRKAPGEIVQLAHRNETRFMRGMRVDVQDNAAHIDFRQRVSRSQIEVIK